jgi:hypothetical protein
LDGKQGRHAGCMLVTGIAKNKKKSDEPMNRNKKRLGR